MFVLFRVCPLKMLVWRMPQTATIATSVPRGAFSWVTKKLRDEKIVSIPLCATNRINAPTTAESILASGSADLVSMARCVLSYRMTYLFT